MRKVVKPFQSMHSCSTWRWEGQGTQLPSLNSGSVDQPQHKGGQTIVWETTVFSMKITGKNTDLLYCCQQYCRTLPVPIKIWLKEGTSCLFSTHKKERDKQWKENSNWKWQFNPAFWDPDFTSGLHFFLRWMEAPGKWHCLYSTE